MQSIQVYENNNLVGTLSILDRESYSFAYDKSWLDSADSFTIDPLLPLDSQTHYNKQLWGAFSDISPDRWGRLIQSRYAEKMLTESEFMLGVSDYFRVGALRLKVGDEFVAHNTNIPKLLHLSQLQDSTLKLEKDKYSQDDLRLLLYPSSSLGGARPKASVEDKGKLYIAKFGSKNDLHSVILWEAVMLELAKRAKIRTANFKIIKANQKPVLLVERFDRDGDMRIPFMSAMSLLKVSEKQDAEYKSYADIAKELNLGNKAELFRRMLFNTLFGNTDDHLRNHALLYDKATKLWHLSPAYDLNPTPYPYEKQRHALNFVECKNLPSLNLCREIAPEFNVSDKDFVAILRDCINAGMQWKNIALNFDIKANEINLFKQNFEHKDIENAKEILKECNMLQKSHTIAHKPNPHKNRNNDNGGMEL